MNKDILIAPSVLAADFSEMGKRRRAYDFCRRRYAAR